MSVPVTKGIKSYGAQTGGRQPPTQPRSPACCCNGGDGCPTPACEAQIGSKAFCVTLNSLSVIQIDVFWGGPYVISATPMRRQACLQWGSHSQGSVTSGVQTFANTLDGSRRVIVSWQLVAYYYSIGFLAPPLELYASLGCLVAVEGLPGQPWGFYNFGQNYLILDTTQATCDETLESSAFTNLDVGFERFSGTISQGACSGGVCCQEHCTRGPIEAYCDWGCCNDSADWICSSDDMPYPIFSTVLVASPNGQVVGTVSQIDLCKAEVNGKCFVYGGIAASNAAFGPGYNWAIACDGTVWGFCPMILPFFSGVGNIFEWRQVGTLAVTSCSPFVATITFVDGVYVGQVLAITE